MPTKYFVDIKRLDKEINMRKTKPETTPCLHLEIVIAAFEKDSELKYHLS